MDKCFFFLIKRHFLKLNVLNQKSNLLNNKKIGNNFKIIKRKHLNTPIL